MYNRIEQSFKYLSIKVKLLFLFSPSHSTCDYFLKLIYIHLLLKMSLKISKEFKTKKVKYIFFILWFMVDYNK